APHLHMDAPTSVLRPKTKGASDIDGIQPVPLSSTRAWSVWSYAYATIVEVVIAAPLPASDLYVSSPRASRRCEITDLSSGIVTVVIGLNADPTIVAAESCRPCRSRKTARFANGRA